MAARRKAFGIGRKNQPRTTPLARAAASVVELLEPRQLLSSVVTAFPVPSPDPTDWDASTGHIVAGPDGNFWFTDPSDNAIGKVTPAGVVTLFPLPVHNAALNDGSGGVGPDDPGPQDIVVGPNGNLWFTENNVDRIGEITTAGVITEFTTPTADSNPSGLTVGSDGDLWFAEENNEAIGRITPDGKITEFPLTTVDVSYEDGMATGSDGNVWFIADDNQGNGVVASITPSGTVTSYELNADPTAIAAGPDGNLWVGTSEGQIDQVSTAGVVSTFALPDGADVNSIRDGTDGNLWFSTDGNNQFGEITPAGVISEFSLPTAGADAGNANISINDLSQATDGTLWFIDADNPQVGTIDLSDALLAAGVNVTVTAGSAATSTFATFTDFSGPSSASDYSATITLSNGSTLPASIAANSAGGFDVTASNDWTIGYDTATVNITDTRDTTRVATAAASLDVTAPQATGTGIDISATSGQLFSGTVATFTGVALNSISQYSATIDWGDGHDTAGAITANADGGFDITGSNRYADAGSYTVTTTLEPYPGGVFYPGGPIGVGPFAPIATPIAEPVSTPISTTTGTGTGTAPSAGTSSLTLLPGLVTSQPDFVAAPTLAPHLAFAGTAIKSSGTGADIAFPIGGDGSATATSTATVSAGVMDGTGYSVQATSTAPFSGNVADFTLADPNADLSHYSATITWSDPGISDWFFSLPNSPSTGVIAPDGNGGFTVSTSASFANGGLFHFVVTISDDRLGTGDSSIVGVAYGQIVVNSPIVWLPVLFANAPTGAAAVPGSASSVSDTDASNPVLAEKVKPIGMVVKSYAGQTFTGDVGGFSGVVSGTTKLADLTGTIHWGDGTTSPAAFVGGTKGYVVVRGSHSYATAGSFAPTVDVTQTLYVNGKPQTLYPLALPTVDSAAKIATPPTHRYIITGGIPIQATAGVAFTDPVASFPAPAAAGVVRTATIYWGDGSHPTAAIVTSGTNELTVTAGHTYRKAGKYTVWVSVTQKAAAGTTGSGVKVPRILAYIKTTAVVSAATA